MWWQDTESGTPRIGPERGGWPKTNWLRYVTCLLRKIKGSHGVHWRSSANPSKPTTKSLRRVTNLKHFKNLCFGQSWIPGRAGLHVWRKDICFKWVRQIEVPIGAYWLAFEKPATTNQNSKFHVWPDTASGTNMTGPGPCVLIMFS
jgi:hypothetical protein